VKEHRIAFVGAGGIASAHALALAVLPYYYPDVPRIVRVAVASKTPASRQSFASRYGFSYALDPSDLWTLDNIDTVFVLGPNELHYSLLQRSLERKNVRYIYVEKPICVTREEEEALTQLAANWPEEKVIQTGFQFLQMSTVRKALSLMREGDFGTPIHFHVRYLHSGYLESSYRNERRSRLKPSPVDGALVDLGSHALSLLVAFMGEDLEIVSARQSGTFPDVPAGSDLCTTILLNDRSSGAAGTLVASRISAGAGDLLELEVRYTGGSLRLSTERPDEIEIFTQDRGEWSRLDCGSDYLPITKFPLRYAPSGWLRSLIHAHYLFFGGIDVCAIRSDLDHALAVQRMIRSAAEQLATTRANHSD
jgi:predicted dehydrogenase